MRSLKSRLEEAMRRHPHLTQADIARACKVKNPSVTDWLNGKTKSLKPEPARLGASLFGCDQNWLSTGVGTPNWIAAPPPTPPVNESLLVRTLPAALGVVLGQLARVPQALQAELLDRLRMVVRYGRAEDARRVAELLATPAEDPEGPNLTPQDREDARRLQEAAIAGAALDIKPKTGIKT